VYRYVSVRGECEQFAAGMVAARGLAAAKARTALLGRLLTGVLPPHVASRVELAARRPTAALFPDAFRRWNNLSVMQVALRFGAVDFDVMSAAWRTIVGATHHLGAGLIEVGQATGDAFLVAGPFVDDADEACCVAAARCYMLLFAALRRDLGGLCGFTAVATAGSAAEALLGSSLLTYRLVGPTIREAEALIDAAPLPLDPAASVAFVTEGFRRQESNYGSATIKAVATLDASMSFAVKSALTVLTEKRPEEDAASPEPGVARACFGTPLLWRVRGVGATVVSAVVDT
jgi:hypothetical protein